MKALIKAANMMMLAASRKELRTRWGEHVHRQFLSLVKKYANRYYGIIPDIGKTVFANSYYFASCYFFYLPALKEMGFDKETSGKVIWIINESMLRAMPGFIRRMAGSYYTNQFRRLGPWAMERSRTGQLHADDWRITYRCENRNEFSIDIHECYVLKMARRLDMLDLFPYVCRMDYLFSHYFNQGFERTMTLGDGDAQCNCHWTIPGKCEWPVSNDRLR